MLTKRLGYVPALDGLRGIAILMVIAGHFFRLGGGGDGVDLFFVLSGFLITTLLLEQRARTGRISLGAFYERRARRLFPALAAMLLVYLLIEAARGLDGTGHVIRLGLYAANIYIPYFAPASSTGLEHLWSLAQEEQFYLIWPLILVLVMRSRRPVRNLGLVVAVLVVYRTELLFTGVQWYRTYFSPDVRSDGLLVGAALAIARSFGFTATRRAGAIGLGFAVCSFVALSFVFDGNNAIYVLQLPFFNLAAALAVSAALTAGPLAAFLSFRPLAGVGKISYSLYLWHYMLLVQFAHHQRMIVLALTIVAATASYYLVEQPFRRRRSARLERAESPSAAIPETV